MSPKMSPSKSMSPATNARPGPSSPGAQAMRRNASADRTWMAPGLSTGPISLPSQNVIRTGTLPIIASIMGRAIAATPPSFLASGGLGAGLR